MGAFLSWGHSHCHSLPQVCWIPSSISLLIGLPAGPEEVMSPHPFPSDGEDPQNPGVIEDSADAQIPTDEEASSMSSSYAYIFPPSPSLSSSPEELSPGMSSLPLSTPSSPLQSPSQNPMSSSSSVSWSPVSGESSSQKGEDTSTSQCLSDSESLFTNTLDEKVAEVVQFLLLKFEAKEPVTEAEMLIIVLSYQDYFPTVLEKAREFMELLFGLALIEVDPDHSYAFADTVDPTDKGSSDDQGTPKNSLLILILSIIFIKGGCASEEAIWNVLNAIGVYAGREHFIYGEPKELLTKVWVQEQYLECREVPNTSPPCYDFLWGPRAHSESSKRKVLEFLAKLNNTVPDSFPSWYKDALKNVGERAQAIISTKDDATDKASESLSDIQHPLLF
ncbi:melanoma-associated antigen C2-like [Sapajus apella]|uniref:Melanoma-associated antigen C2-like n=1 Tax=Sapajus apella TaxID=9515 RepID=A0A6J3G2V4_SAPAP|nr:melanoma-associated antigen C2-like [Sapajus apella]